MLNAPSFSEDMLPRHFPKAKGQLELKSAAAAAPTPTLPGLSLLLDDDNKVFKPDPPRKVEPKKSFEQWKQQHHTKFAGNEEMYQRKSEKKQVRFETNKSNEHPPNQRPLCPVVPNLEQSYYDGSDEQNFCSNLRPNYHQHQHNSKEIGHCGAHDKNVLLTKCNHKPMSPTFTNDKAYSAASQLTNELPHFNRVVRAESMKENCISGPYVPVPKNQHRQCNGNCCQTSHNNWEMTNYQTCDYAVPNGCVGQRQLQQSNKREVQPKSFSPYNERIERNLKEQVTDDTLLSIMEEQQQHILLQQNQIMMQQKQNMIQQQQIFMLQRQVQKLLHRTGNHPIESPSKLCPTSICDRPTPQTMTNPLQSATKTRNGAIDSVCNGAKSSIGVMTSFLGNVNDGMPNGMQQFNERFASKVTNEKFIENMGGFSAEEYSDKDSMLDKINDAIKNSSAMIDYRGNKAGGSNSPKRQTDINIAAQALFYETSSTNNGCTTEQKTTDRSFALYMLGMKYDCAQDDASKKVEKRDWQPQQTNGKSDQVSVNLSPEVYDYLKRHGLLHQE
ncbi:uncharacterized protein LOC119080019 [Bradysia coprophila]|uniref:uncharacterized protein LOC119080019 n=1 Tax=Bradysia coprophila TaxID=38358 RepID=UPI00187D7BEB|nr:uncharacterized protein LOC119080019 [Bradysia coprophila]